MSQLSQRVRDRKRTAMRRASGFVISSIRVGLVELLAGEVPAEVFSQGAAEDGYAPPLHAPMMMPGVPLRVRVRRLEGGFKRRFLAGARLVPGDAPSPRRAAVGPYIFSPRVTGSGYIDPKLARMVVTHAPVYYAGLQTLDPVLPGGEGEAEWDPQTAMTLVELHVPHERLTPASGRRLPARSRRARR